MYRRNKIEQGEKDADEYTISYVSKVVGLSQKTIRDYEKMDLIKPRREPRTNNRIYSDFEIDQIKRISHLIHSEGFTLPCIRRLLQLAPCWNIFDCEVSANCPAYKHPHIPCYEVRNEMGTLCSGSCDQCAVFLKLPAKKEKVLNRPESKE